MVSSTKKFSHQPHLKYDP